LFENLCGIYNDPKSLTANEKAEMCSSICSVNKQEPQKKW